MKKRIKQTALLVLSCASLMATAGYSSWIVQSHKEYALNNRDTTSKPVAYIVGNDKVKYTSIEKALEVAKSGDIVCVIPPTEDNYKNIKNGAVKPNSIQKVTYHITRNCEIKEGVSLIIPTDQKTLSSVTDSTSLNNYIKSMRDSERDQGDDGYSSYANSQSNLYLRVTLEIDKNVVLKNAGTLIISGYLSGGNNNAGVIGQTSHSYSRVVLNQGATIIQDNTCDNANIFCFGYITEKSINNGSSLVIKKGNLYIPQIISDYRGFYYSYAMTVEAIDKKRASPFNEFEFRNIDVETSIYFGASVFSVVNLYVKYEKYEVDETVHDIKNVVGKDSSYFIQLSDVSNGSGGQVSCLKVKYNSKTNVSKITAVGGFTLNNFAINIKVQNQPLPLSTANAFFPVSYHHDIELESLPGQLEAKFDCTKQRLKFLTGSKLKIGENVSVQGNEIIAYSSFYDGSIGNGQGIGNPGRLSYPLKEGAFIQVESNGKIDCTSLAGYIYCDSKNRITSKNANGLTVFEPWEQGPNSNLIKPWTIKNYLSLTEKLNIVPILYSQKYRIFVGMNAFDVNPFSPSIQIETNDLVRSTISDAQAILFFDNNPVSYKIEPVNNIYQIFDGTKRYSRNTIVPFSSKYAFIGATNSNLTISNNKNGKNEFDVQKISISGSSGKIDVGSVLQLQATIEDIEKSYEKNYVWSSTDSGVASVDKNGLVKGLSTGLCSIKVTCGGVIGEYPIEVVEPSVEKVLLDSSLMSITSNDNKQPKDDFKDGTYSFTLEAKPAGSKMASCVWTMEYKAGGATKDKQYLVDEQGNKVDSISFSDITTSTISIKLAGGAAANSDYGSPDEVNLKCVVSDSANGNTYTFEFYVINENACLLSTSLVLMADGSYKEAGLIKTGDMVMSFNHETGKIEPNLVIGNDHQKEKGRLCCVVHLVFSNGVQTDFLEEHGYFDLTLNRYVYLHPSDCDKYIGHKFVSINKNLKISEVELLSFDCETIVVKPAAPATAKHLNLIADNMLALEGGLDGLFNIFDYDPETLAFDKVKMNADIKKYGLLSYKDFEHFFPKEIYDLLPCKYLGVSIGKGLITWKIFESYVKKWKDQLMENVK